MDNIKDYIKSNLKLKIDHTQGRIEVKLILSDEVISSDFIDYTDVVRVVKRLNNNAVH